MKKPAHDIPFTRSVRRHWRLIILEGTLLIILGWLAIFIPPTISLAPTYILDWVFLSSGLIGLITTISGRHAPGFWWSLLSAILAIGVGAVLIEWHNESVVSLTEVLLVFFVVEGVATIMYAIEHRRRLSGRWEWLLASGVVDLALAALVVSLLPQAGIWAAGILVGINMVFGGSALVAMAIHVHMTARRAGDRS
jgi:uncharacterized membrane protein HdeD (DUF308 family)